MSQKVNLDTLTINELNLYQEKAASLKDAGQIVTLSGVGLIGISIILMGASFEAEGGSWLTEELGANVIMSAFIGGMTTTIVGIPLWAVGGNRKTKAEVALKNFKIRPGNSMAVGLGITIKF